MNTSAQVKDLVKVKRTRQSIKAWVSTRRTNKPGAAELEEEVVTLATEISSLDLGHLDTSVRVDCWITDNDETRKLQPSEGRLPVDVTFILEKEVTSLLLEVTKQDFQKADDAAALTHLWSLFFKQSFLNSVGAITYIHAILSYSFMRSCITLSISTL